MRNICRDKDTVLRQKQDFTSSTIQKERQKQESTKLHMAYFRVHSLASVSYLPLSDLYRRAISGTNGSSGFGSVSNEHIDKRTATKKKYHRSNNFIT